MKLGNDPHLSPSLHTTPRPSITSTALTDNFARTLYKINANLQEMKRMSSVLGGPSDSHDQRAKLYLL